MKKSITLFVCTCMMLLLATINSAAQCAIVGINAENETVSIPIPCDFPLFVSTGDEAQDLQNYLDYKNAWIASHADIYAAMESIASQYYEIHLSDFNQMSAERQAAILSNPERYHIAE